MPLCDFQDDCTSVIDLIPPMELHLMLGVVNDFYDCLDNKLKENGISITTKNWADSLGLSRSAHYGGQFNGNQCRTLLDNTDKLQKILQEADAHHIGKPIIDAFIAFNMIRQTCFATLRTRDYQTHINKFAEIFLKLGLSVTPKVHAVLVHVSQFLQRQIYSDKGLGHWSEQASETVHSNFQSLYVGSSHKRAITHKDYGNELYKCVVSYNSRHQ